ncbi:hypothetical protein MRB53_022937 [Persea americana]|uniref:Uncharacterized protein n=1 Tax=Persea americana TaxID=3435 RepID=A0ACC2L836_PERAE|nr:hypothetical protein MRB53_022937 [Persea americana]
MAAGVVSVLLNKLYELIEKEAHLLARVEPEVKLLRQKLEWISLSLEEADEKCPEDKQIKLWVAQFENLSTLQEFAPSLIKLHICDSRLLEDSMAVLEKLPKLQFLTLHDVRSYSAMKMSCSTKGFPMLESFNIRYCQELEDWTIEEGGFANLRYLEICWCKKLKMIPEGLQHVTTLQELVLVKQPLEFCEKVRENGLDWFKIQHVQSVKIES